MFLRVSAGQSIDQKADFLRTPIQGDAIPWSKLLDSALLLAMMLWFKLVIFRSALRMVTTFWDLSFR